MHFYPHNIADFNNATRHLTRVERSVYRDAIELYYDTEEPLTLDIQKLEKRLLCSSKEESEALNSVLIEFFTKTEQGYFNERCDAEIKKYRANTSAKARAGIASAAARKQKSTRVKQPLNACTTDEQQTNNQEPINNKQSKGRFTPPTFEQVQQYCLERKNGIDPQDFIDHYATSNWHRGKTKVSDWKACVRTWEGKRKTGPPRTGSIIDRLQDTSWVDGPAQ